VGIFDVVAIALFDFLSFLTFDTAKLALG
jgi:hypothetical protein